VSFEHGDDRTFERIEFAGAPGILSGLVGRLNDPLLHRFGIKMKFDGDLRSFQVLLIVEKANPAEG
jgi:hypothetical protein